MFEIYCDATADIGLDLPQTPIRLLRMFHDHSRFKNPVHFTYPDCQHMPQRQDLSALIGSRICHDLISPIGAIGNGIELLIMDGATKSPEIALISDSVTHANARIRFFRVAFGAAAGDQRIGSPEVASILSDMTRGGRVTITWDAPADLSRPEVKLAFLALLCLESAMPFGGRITVSARDGWRLTASSVKLRPVPELWQPLIAGQIPDTTAPAQVHFPLLAQEAADQNRPLTIETTAETIRIGF